MAILKLLHLLSAVLWVGGMFFAYTALRPAAVEILAPPERLRLWSAVFRRFLHAVWGAIVVLVASGIAMIASYGGLGNVPTFIHIMLLLGTLMIAIFVWVYFAGYRKLRMLVTTQQWPEAGRALGGIRQWIAINLILGIVTLCVVGFGRAGYL